MSDTLITPLGGEEFSLLMQRHSPFSKKIALAVSGGPDSMALAYCVKRWAGADFVALIVEHGLRPESPEEAAGVKARLDEMGISAVIIPWTHDKIGSRVHVQARDARYRLLIEACRRLGVCDLLLAHHGDDQAETILMRLAKGSGVFGLAGMPETQDREGVRILRPFLALPKARLVATCEAAGVKYVLDPSNESERYARGRLRRMLPLLESEGMTVENLLTLGRRAKEASEAIEFVAKEYFSKSARIEAGGSLCLDRRALAALPRAISLRALEMGLRYVHDEQYAPEYAAMTSLMDTICDAGKEGARTLYGCIVSLSETKVLILREPAAARAVLPLSSGETVIWDGRWSVCAGSLPFLATVRALGFPPHEIIDALAPDLRRKIPQGRIRATLPGVFEGNVLRAIPSFEEGSGIFMSYKNRAPDR